MKQILIIMLLIGVLACSNPGVDPTPEVTPSPTPMVTPEPTPVATPEPTLEPTPESTPEATPEVTPEVTPEPTSMVEDQELSQDEIDKVNQKILVNRNNLDYTFVSTGVKQMNIGDSYYFAFGIKNTNSQEQRFRTIVEILSAESMEGGAQNDVYYSEKTLLSWIGSEYYEEITIPGNEVGIVTVPITIGQERAPHFPTIPANYVFGLGVEIIGDNNFGTRYDNEFERLVLRVE